MKNRKGYTISHFAVKSSFQDKVSKVWDSTVDIVFTEDPDIDLNDCMCWENGQIVIRVLSKSGVNDYRCQVIEKENPQGMLHRFLVDAKFYKWRSNYGEMKKRYEKEDDTKDSVYGKINKEELIKALEEIFALRQESSGMDPYDFGVSIDAFDKAMKKIYSKEKLDINPVILLPKHTPLDMEMFKQRWLEHLVGGDPIVYGIDDFEEPTRMISPEEYYRAWSTHTESASLASKMAENFKKKMNTPIYIVGGIGGSCQEADFRTIEELNIKAEDIIQTLKPSDKIKKFNDYHKFCEDKVFTAFKQSSCNPSERTGRAKKRK